MLLSLRVNMFLLHESMYFNNSVNNSSLVSFALLLYFNRATNYICYYCCTIFNNILMTIS